MKASAGKRVLMLLQNCAYPQDDRVRREAKTLVAAGYQVSVISPKWSVQVWTEVVEGVHVLRFPPPPPAGGLAGYLWEYGYSMAVMFAMSLLVWIGEGFDILHAHHPPDTFVFIAAFYKLFGKRYVLDHHDLAPELYDARFGGNGRPALFRVLVWLEKLACRLADHVIATNQSYKAMEMQRGGVPEANITIVRNGPDLNELRVADTPHQSLPTTLTTQGAEPGPGAEHPAADLPSSGLEQNARLRTGKTILGYVGVIGFQDGVDYLLRALRHLAGDFGRRDFQCILVGHGDAVPGLKALTQQLALGEYVSFTGWVDEQSEVARYLSIMDVCLAPEPSNPFNDRSTAAKVMEYMAFGKPVVAFDLPEHRFSAQDAAVYARPNDELDFARQIVLLMDDPVRCERMGRVGRVRIETELAWSQQSKQLLQAYEILQRGVR